MIVLNTVCLCEILCFFLFVHVKFRENKLFSTTLAKISLTHGTSSEICNSGFLIGISSYQIDTNYYQKLME